MTGPPISTGSQGPAQPSDPHVPADIAVGYARGAADPATAVAVEVHLETCQECRSMVNAAADPARLDRNWMLVAGELDLPRRGLLERFTVWCGLPGDTARLMAATPTLRRSWYVAVLVALLFGLIAASPDRPEPSVLVFLVLAPLIPVLGVGLAYGRGGDPSYEISAATPMSGLRLLLTRAVAVVVTSIGLAGVASLVLTEHHALAAAWLLPALGLSSVCLALCTWMSARAAAVAVSVSWLFAGLVMSLQRGRELDAFGPVGQVVALGLAGAGLAVLWARRDRLDEAGVRA